ncbi:60S ribosomal protein L9 putative [Entamoeba histolytica]|uniref:60S ribosomal protein L9, putative n=2 Tax=Entamoeba histolytica TaxID=5759 RepID=C4M9B0_ENTH1|nr:60S ribosomal protein L9, putative [Entamoeba histolytica HM-1:IMSS]EAL43981.1 60S ribosomal protein L9, putative [Entamoeba histolytica HM-1:IMSS]GAT98244.1 60S ribosomal protein L9 putative [Entamoeba histolytica]|eukprot:XP_649368.1 60S ribosomal protein L9, putative [Entamoeba histolytica HM-1:IMSS]
MPRLLKKTEHVVIPEGVTIEINKKNIKVTGPRGTLTREFQHPKVDIYASKLVVKKEGPKENVVVIDMWYGNRRDSAVVRTIASHIKNMITGVTKGYQYKMRVVYAHFPVTLVIADDGKSIQVQNFLGEKRTRHIEMYDGVVVKKLGKDEICLEGNDVEKVSQSAANIHAANLVRNKDIRQFLDGVYVSEKCLIENDA